MSYFDMLIRSISTVAAQLLEKQQNVKKLYVNVVSIFLIRTHFDFMLSMINVFVFIS